MPSLPALSARAQHGAASSRPPWRGAPLQDAIVLTGGFPGADILPAATLADAYHAVLTSPDAGQTALQYHHAEGTDDLRAWIADQEHTTPDRILVTNGALHSVSFLLEALVDPGDLVVTEDPTYPLALALFDYHGARVRGVPTDGDGFDVDRFEALLEQGERPKLLYLIPDFQNPSGVTLAAERRHRLTELAEHHGFVIVSDGPYRYLRFSGAEVPDFDPASDRVTHANTFSKLLGPGLRLGWLLAPPWLQPHANRVRWNTDQNPSLVTQRAVHHIVSDQVRFDAIVADARAQYSRRATALHDALVANLGDRFEASRPDGGLFLWARVPGADIVAVHEAARGLGLDFSAGPGFSADHTNPGHGDAARFAYSAVAPETLATAAARFAAAVDQATS